jgi:preprotein translocase subunit SecE
MTVLTKERKLELNMSFVNDSVQFFKEAYVELKKVTWPGRKEIIAATIVVSILVIIVAAYVGVIDFFLARILGILLR